MTALHRGAKGGDIKTIKYIVENRLVDVNQLVRTSTYPMFEHVKYYNTAIFEAFPFCFKDYGGWTALIWAAEFSNTEVARFLMSVGSAPTIRDKVAPSSNSQPHS